MSSLSNEIQQDNDELNKLLEEAVHYVRSSAKSGVAAHHVEKRVFDYALKLGRELLGAFFHAQGDGDVGEQLILPDQAVKKLEKRKRMYRSLLGDFVLNRYVYGTREGQAIVCVPLDTRLQLPEEESSYPLQEVMHLLVTEVSYITARGILEKMLKLNVTVDSMEHINRHSGEVVATFREAQAAPVAETEGKIVAISADGKGVPICHPKDAARICDQQSKRGPKPDRKRMAVVGAAYTIDPYVRTPDEVLEALFCDPNVMTDQDKPKRPPPQNKRVVAHLSQGTGEEEIKASALTFTWLSQQIKERHLEQEKAAAKQKSSVEPKVHIALIDGQPSLWEKVDQLKKECPVHTWVEILDLMHANSYLWEAAAVFHPGDSKQQLVFMKDRVLRLLQGKVGLVISGLRQMATKQKIKKSGCTIIKKVCRYFSNNHNRMKYDEYLAAGYSIATGVIEGACRHFVKDRMERAGMRWTIKGAQAMLNMRSVNLNGDFEEFNQYRIQEQTKKIHPHTATIGVIAWPVAA